MGEEERRKGGEEQIEPLQYTVAHTACQASFSFHRTFSQLVGWGQTHFSETTV